MPAEWRRAKAEYDAKRATGTLAEGESAPTLEASTTSRVVSETFDEQAVSHYYNENHGIIILEDDDAMIALDISDYAVSGADAGTQDSELIAESIRYKANYPRGKNKVAVAVAGRFL